MERIAVRDIIRIGDGVLIGKRNGKVEKDKYSLFGGKVDPGETVEQAARREATEETELELENLVFWKDEINDKTISGQPWHTYYFIGDAKGDIKIKIDENSEAVVVDRRNFEKYDLTFGHKEILEEYFGLR